ncbi:hypothetical protein [Streptomyces klenkii]|uniref:hypothetical protein n=1 Tax=Streptomyces klenkii TaxID=1420899 RepID=UPI0034272184
MELKTTDDPQRQNCAEPGCDDGALLDSGRSCPRCGNWQVDRRAQHRAVAVSVSEAGRREATDRQPRETVTAQTRTCDHQWAQVREQQAVAAQGRAEQLHGRGLWLSGWCQWAGWSHRDLAEGAAGPLSLAAGI